MPSKRKTNEGSTQKRGRRAASADKLQRRRAVEEPEQIVDPDRLALKNDLTGVVIAVIAVAMFIALLSTSDAPLTRAANYGLRLGFGIGAPLVPLAALLFSFTFFMVSEKPISKRVACGLTLIVLSLLAMLSLALPQAEINHGVLFTTDNLIASGGYVGAGLAWALISLVGRVIGYVVLVGLTIAGIVVCGLSISGVVQKLYERYSKRAAERAERKAASKESLEAAVNAGFLDEDGEDSVYPFADGETAAEPKTTFLGARKTSILKRGDKVAAQRAQLTEVVEPTASTDDAAVEDSFESAPTTLREVQSEVAPKTTKLKKASRKVSKGSLDDSKQLKIDDAHLSDSKPKIQAVKLEDAKRPGDGVATIELPPLSLLASNPNSDKSASSKKELNDTARKLQDTLAEFGLKSRVVGYASGPLVTTYKIEMGEGERVNRITNLQDDIQLSLASESVRIFAPIPGTSLVGIEIPNTSRQSVYLGDVLPFAQGGPLEFSVGRDSEGRPVVANLAKMPHLLIAGTTGSGKSVMINSIIMSILMRATPEQVRLILVDPKRVEFSCYNGIPHLYVPVVTEPRQASSALQWAVTEMERRLKVFERAQARDIRVYNKMCVSGKLSELEHPPTPMPYLVIVIDELSDLMMVAGKEVEASIVRIAQLARAAGIHLIVATQRPSADVVTGLIKSNIDSRIALKVSSSIDSRVILDSTGAERLLGHGDMLFRYSGSNTKRILGCYTSDEEIETAVDFIREQAEPDYHDEILSAVVPQKPGAASGGADAEDDLFWDAAQIVVETQIGSTSGLQRRLSVGYARAGRIMDMLEAKGIVGPPDGSKPREVLMDQKLLDELRNAESTYQEVE